MQLTTDQIEGSYPVPEKITRRPWMGPCIAYWIPIAYRDDVLQAYRRAGIKVRARYRGPRNPDHMITLPSGRTYPRGRARAMQDCLRCDATHFSVYRR